MSVISYWWVILIVVIFGGLAAYLVAKEMHFSWWVWAGIVFVAFAMAQYLAWRDRNLEVQRLTANTLTEQRLISTAHQGLGLNGLYLNQPTNMPIFIGELCAEKSIYQIERKGAAHNTRAKAQHVHVVVFDTLMG